MPENNRAQNQKSPQEENPPQEEVSALPPSTGYGMQGKQLAEYLKNLELPESVDSEHDIPELNVK